MYTDKLQAARTRLEARIGGPRRRYVLSQARQGCGEIPKIPAWICLIGPYKICETGFDLVAFLTLLAYRDTRTSNDRKKERD